MKVLLCLVARDLLSKLKLDWVEIMESGQVHAIKPNLENNPNPVSDLPKGFEPGLGKLGGLRPKYMSRKAQYPFNKKQDPSHLRRESLWMQN